jgi:carbamoyltransferase
MPLILGLHFGHDASITVLIDGQIGSFVQRERLSRIKHAYSLDRNTLDTALSRAKIDVKSIDAVAVTSTQGSEPLLINLPGVSLHYDAAAAIGPPSTLLGSLGDDEAVVLKMCVPSMSERVLGQPRDPKTHPAFEHYLAEYQNIPFDKLRRFPWLEVHAELPDWKIPQGIDSLKRINVEERLSDERCRLGFHYPLQVTIDGHKLPGVRLDHHFAHAASSYYRSGSNHALVLTNDGYGGRRIPFANGGVYIGLGNRLSALAPHFLTHGYLYDYVGRTIGFSAIGSSGKLMGLAPYGSPDYYDHRFAGNSYDHELAGIDGSPEGWIRFARERCRALGQKEDNAVSADLPFTEFQLNLAASTQKIFEQTWLSLIDASYEMLKSNRLNIDTLCLSGGAALNCPSNSRIFRESNFRDMFVEPTCDDSGLSTGAAYWLYYSLLDMPIKRKKPFSAGEAYTHGYSADQVETALRANSGHLHYEKLADHIQSAAADLAAGKIIGWFEGGSEMGPRALGHRSILANPQLRSIHYKVNKIKDRELWRPLAPAVLEEHASKHFDLNQMPESSPFMLLTARVLNPALAAVTHVDGSARIQTVTEENGDFYLLLCAFNDLTGIPVVLNTSMNGPGQPIVETAEEAAKFFLQTGIDVFYVDGFRLTRRSG